MNEHPDQDGQTSPERAEPVSADQSPLRIRSLPGHRVLTPTIFQAELAEELFGRGEGPTTNS